MKFLIDQDVYAVTIRFLRELGHDRILPSNQKGVHQELERVLQSYLEDELRNAFTVKTYVTAPRLDEEKD